MDETAIEQLVGAEYPCIAARYFWSIDLHCQNTVYERECTSQSGLKTRMNTIVFFLSPMKPPIKWFGNEMTGKDPNTAVGAGGRRGKDDRKQNKLARLVQAQHGQTFQVADVNPRTKELQVLICSCVHCFWYPIFLYLPTTSAFFYICRKWYAEIPLIFLWIDFNTSFVGPLVSFVMEVWN